MKAKFLDRSEYDECIALVEYLNILQRQKKITMYTHIPNETFTLSWNQKRKNTAMGVAKGFPDYVILSKNTVIFIEMKKEKNSITSVEQKIWINEINKVGIIPGLHSVVIAKVCRGFNEAKEFIEAVI